MARTSLSSSSSRQVRLLSCVGVRHDLAMLPHFLRHYLELGVPPEHMHIILNAPREDVAELEEAARILDGHGISPAARWIAPYTSDSMWQQRRELQRRVARADDWILSADVDELHEYPDALETVLDHCDRRSINCIQGPFIDRLAPDGVLARVSPQGSIWEQFPIAADVICTVRGGAREPGYLYGSVKMMAHKGDVLPGRGGHFPAPGSRRPTYLFGANLAQFPFFADMRLRFAIPARVHHFKWVASLLPGLQERLATAGASSRGRSYGGLLLDYFSANDRIRVEDIPVAPDPMPGRDDWRRRSAALRAIGRPVDLLARARALLRAGTE